MTLGSSPGEELTEHANKFTDHDTGPDTGPAAWVRSTGLRGVRTVVEQLAVSPRSSQRHLAAEGKTFATVLDEARRERAMTLLTESDLPLAQIASTVGLHSSATLSRYARRDHSGPRSELHGPQ